MSSFLGSKQPLPTASGNEWSLEAGDHLTRAEFEQRYARQPDLKKAELIEGIVYMPSPVRLQQHGAPHLQLALWIGTYQAATPGTAAADNTTIRLDTDNEPQPDVLLCVLPTHGGRVRISDDDYLEGAPEWIGEVASSTVSYDLHSKWNAYRRNRVREYLVVLPRQGEVRWFELRADRYQLLDPQEGILRSRQFPGLWLNAPALLAGDAAALLATLRTGLDSPEHDAFVRRLQDASKRL